MNSVMERGKYILAVVLYGTIGMFLRFVRLPSEVVVLARGVLGAGFILLFQLVRGRRPDRAAIRRNRKWLLLGGVCLGLNWVFLFAAYVKTTVAVASLCNYMAPAIVVLLAPPVLRERLDLRKLPSVAVALLGILLVSGVGHGAGGSLSGVVMGLLAAVCFVGIVLCNRMLRDISPWINLWCSWRSRRSRSFPTCSFTTGLCRFCPTPAPCCWC